MGKPQKKKNLSDKVRKTKTAADIKNNPFEVKINRQKFEILGRKSKHDIGLPGVSRSKAIKKRKETLLKEYKLKDKTNKFIDKRFGEYDTKMAPEDKILKRFALERQRNHEKKDIYTLNEEEELTHFGQSLADIEKLNDNFDSDSDTEEKGLLSGRGGVLEPEGTVEIKFRKKDLVKTMRRVDPVYSKLAERLGELLKSSFQQTTNPDGGKAAEQRVVWLPG
ncbi:UNVERIFIED_CONTAM: hypothetical protein FKN15_010350 [Acipenser sinensis]